MRLAGDDHRRRSDHQHRDAPQRALPKDRGQVVQAPVRRDADPAVLLDHVVAPEGDDQPVVGPRQKARVDFRPAALQHILGSVAANSQVERGEGITALLENAAHPAAILRVTDSLHEGIPDKADASILGHTISPVDEKTFRPPRPPAPILAGCQSSAFSPRHSCS